MKFVGSVLALMLFTGCAVKSVTSTHLKTKNSALLKTVAIGADKAEILRTFGAPIKIEMEDKKFKYTYFDNQKAKVTIHFDTNNKVASITK